VQLVNTISLYGGMPGSLPLWPFINFKSIFLDGKLAGASPRSITVPQKQQIC